LIEPSEQPPRDERQPESLVGAVEAVSHLSETGEVPNWAPPELKFFGWE
jgi:hypothetical protein